MNKHSFQLVLPMDSVEDDEQTNVLSSFVKVQLVEHVIERTGRFVLAKTVTLGFGPKQKQTSVSVLRL